MCKYSRLAMFGFGLQKELDVSVLHVLLILLHGFRGIGMRFELHIGLTSRSTAGLEVDVDRRRN